MTIKHNNRTNAHRFIIAQQFRGMRSYMSMIRQGNIYGVMAIGERLGTAKANMNALLHRKDRSIEDLDLFLQTERQYYDMKRIIEYKVYAAYPQMRIDANQL